MKAYIAIKYHPDHSNRKVIEGISASILFYNEYDELADLFVGALGYYSDGQEKQEQFFAELLIDDG